MDLKTGRKSCIKRPAARMYTCILVKRTVTSHVERADTRPGAVSI